VCDPLLLLVVCHSVSKAGDTITLTTHLVPGSISAPFSSLIKEEGRCGPRRGFLNSIEDSVDGAQELQPPMFCCLSFIVQREGQIEEAEEACERRIDGLIDLDDGF